MKKSLSVSIAFVIIVALAVVFALSQKTEAPDVQNSSQTTDSSPQPTQQPAAGGSYVEYSEAALAEAEGQKVLFFHAPWCPQCRSIEAGINEQGVPEGYTIIKVDYDTNQDLRQRYEVTLQTTFVKIDDNGNEIDKYVAYDEPTFDAVKREFL